jgi:pimeloyl-ACP methyl ester carboxylesterase
MRGEVAGPGADQYALGRTLMEMLVGGTLPQAHKQALAELPVELPGALRDTLARATMPAAADRFPSVSEFAAALAAVDLKKYPPPRRLAPEMRVRAPFGWSAGAAVTEMVGPDLQRADFRLTELEAARLIPAEALAKLREQTGYAEVSWSVYGNTGRLGRLNDPSAYARATEVVILMHGLVCNRRVWGPTATFVCRDHAQALVIAPDLHGFGGSRFLPGVTDERVGPVGLLRLLDLWLSMLGLRELPMVLVGHSMAATGLLAMGEEDLGERTSRVAITPVFPAVDDAYKRRLRFAASLVASLGRATPIKSLMGLMLKRAASEYADVDRKMLADEFKKAPAGLFGALLRHYSDARPPEGEKLQRCLVVVAEDDPVAPPEMIEHALDALKIPRTHVRRLTGSGHFPQGEQKDHPGWTNRNVVDLVNCIGSMLRASSEGTPMPTQVASTMMGSTEPPRST